MGGKEGKSSCRRQILGASGKERTDAAEEETDGSIYARGDREGEKGKKTLEWEKKSRCHNARFASHRRPKTKCQRKKSADLFDQKNPLEEVCCKKVFFSISYLLALRSRTLPCQQLRLWRFPFCWILIAERAITPTCAELVGCNFTPFFGGCGATTTQLLPLWREGRARHRGSIGAPHHTRTQATTTCTTLPNERSTTIEGKARDPSHKTCWRERLTLSAVAQLSPPPLPRPPSNF